MSGTRTRYRQEYLYGLRFAVSLAEHGTDSDEQFSEQRTTYVEPAVEPLTYPDLMEALAKLPKDNRDVIQQLFFCGRTEAEVAWSLSLSQRGVSKRKQAALRLLRKLLQEK